MPKIKTPRPSATPHLVQLGAAHPQASHYPALMRTHLGGLIAVIDTGGEYNVMVSRATFIRRDTALAYADTLERQMAAQAESGGGDGV